jgi:hypothetical protein
MKASKHKHRNINSKRRTRKMKGGRSLGGIDVKIESASENQYINPSSNSLCSGCRSDNTTAIGAYSLKTPLPDWPASWNKGIMVGGGGGGRGKGKGKGKGNRKGRGKKGGAGFTCGGCGQICNKPPLQFLQSGGGKGRGRGKRSRKMGGGGFWDFAKPFWNPSNPGAVGYENGYKVLAPSCKGISPSGLGSPVSTAGYEPDRKPWSAEFRNDKHIYQKGGGHTKGYKNKSRKMKGGNVVNDIVNFGRAAVHGVGTTFNNYMGVSNDIYASPPNPLFGQFPRGFGTGNNIASEKQFMDIKPFDIKNIYKNATTSAANT